MKVYKFRGGNKRIFNRDLDSLIESKVWYAKLVELNDPLEGSIDHNYLRDQVHKMNRKYRAKNKSVREEAMRILFDALDSFIARREKVGIYALSTDYKNEPLWAYYGSNHEGFCIEYDLELLLTSYRDQPIYQTKVVYSQNRPQITTKDMDALRKGKTDSLIQKLLGTKSSRWGNEEEIRLISDYPGLNTIHQDAVTAIYLGHKMKKSRKRKILKTFYGKELKIFQMMPDESSYGLKEERIQ